MKYEAVIETDDYKDFKFFEDGNGKYIHGIDAGAENNEWIALYFKECKQESIFDKIKAEIEEQKKGRCFDDDDMVIYRTGLEDALYIIDKYRAESEG